MPSPEHLALQQRLRAKVEKPANPPTPDGTAIIFWATVQTVNTGPASLNLVMSTGDVVPTVRYDASLTASVGLLVWGFHVGSDYYVAGARKS